jgi:hypothetical protein
MPSPIPLLIKDPSGIWLAKYSAHPHAAALLVDFSLLVKRKKSTLTKTGW